SVVDGWTTFR
nr:RecName: Full=Pectinesterase; Short=PE; AltName: Full=Pectin methylesterase [Capsicum annuum var. annuum]